MEFVSKLKKDIQVEKEGILQKKRKERENCLKVISDNEANK